MKGGCFLSLKTRKRQKTLTATPWINKLVSQASQVEEKCFRSKRPNFAKQKRILPVSRASRCSLQSASGAGKSTGGGKRQNKRPEAMPRAFCFGSPLTCLHVFGRRTMRQTSSLTALVGRISKEILPPVRAQRARRVERSGPVGGKKTRKETAFGDLFSCWLPLRDSNQRHPD